MLYLKSTHQIVKVKLLGCTIIESLSKRDKTSAIAFTELLITHYFRLTYEHSENTTFNW